MINLSKDFNITRSFRDKDIAVCLRSLSEDQSDYESENSKTNVEDSECYVSEINSDNSIDNALLGNLFLLMFATTRPISISVNCNK